MAYDANNKPVCDMQAGCTAPITHLDKKGFIYCHEHGMERRDYQPCRKLRPHEIRRIESGKPIERY